MGWRGVVMEAGRWEAMRQVGGEVVRAVAGVAGADEG